MFFIGNNILENKKDNDTLLGISKLIEIQNELASYHFNFGRYPIAKEDITINKSVLCNKGFYNSSEVCENVFWVPTQKEYKMDFIYKANSDGKEYIIQFKTQVDNKILGCVHNKKEKKEGCVFNFSLKNGLSIEK